MKKERYFSHLLSLVVVFALVLSSIPWAQVPVYATGETGSQVMLTELGEIIAYEELAPDIAAQTVPLGTDESALNLPEMLAAKVLLPSDVTSAVYGSVSPVTLPIPVIWTSYPTYDGNSAGEYIFTATAEGYTVSTAPPVITITVGKVTEGAITGIITGFAELPEDIRWQNTMSPEFPEAVEGTVEGNKVRIPVTWEADHDYDGEQPQRGLYVFTAVLDQGYSVADSVELPRLTVFIPQTAGSMMARLAGSGTAGNPLEITTAAQLAEIATLVNARPNGLELFLFNDENDTVSLKLMNHIDLSAYSKGDGWTPIGKDYTTPFKGIFDGNNNTISGLYINCNAELQGLFGHIAGGTVRNLGVTNVRVTGYRNVGSLAGCVAEGSVENCYSSGSVTGTGTGHNEGWRVGGLVGYVSISTVANCYSTCSVTGVSDVGGIAGNVYYSTIQNCYSTGSVMGKNNIGGVAGNIWHYVTLENCAALNAFISGNDNVGRVSGNGGDLSNNYALSDMSGRIGTIPATWYNKGLSERDGADVTKENLSDSSFWTNSEKWDTNPWDSSVWSFENNKLPVLKGFDGQDGTFPPHISGSVFTGSGTSDTDPYLIKTAADLAKLAELINAGISPYADANKYYRLENDLDLSAYSSGEGWTPIGVTGKQFKSHFDGNHKVITGLYIERESDHQGLFGYIYGGTVKNVGLTNVSITAEDYVGGVAGRVNSGSVANCYSIGSAKGKIYVGGVAGYLNDGTVENCYSSGSISGDYVGGVVGCVASNSGSLQYCYSSSDVSGDSNVGGVVGYRQYGTVKNCAALNSSINKTSGEGVGRIEGGNISGTRSNNYAFRGIDGTWENIGLSEKDGADVTKEELSNSSFWTAAGNWNGSPWDSSVWSFENNKLPVLKGFDGQDGTFPSHISGSHFAGSGTSDTDPYLIKTAADLAKLAELVNTETSPYADENKYYRLENDLDLSVYSRGEGWTPIGKFITGDNNIPFKGHFDGNHKVITGLYINRDDDSQGLFGYIKGGSVQNLGVLDVDITCRSVAGGVAARVVGGGTIENCYSSGRVSCNNSAGGVVGYIDGGSVQNCYSTGTVIGTGDDEYAGRFIGGVVGFLLNGNMKNCYSTGSVTGIGTGGNAGRCIGGVAGYIWENSTVENCAALNSLVSGNNNVGRVTGYKGGNILLKNNYAFSSIPGTWENKGLSSVDGDDVTAQDLFGQDFWTTPENWNGGPWDSNVWIIADHKLPVLKGIAGQSGDGGLLLMRRDIQYATVTLDQTSFTYNGSLQRPNLTVTFAGETLAENRDYTLAITSMDGNGQSAGTKAGEVTLTITGKGNFSGAKSINYTIEESPGGGNTGRSSSGGSPPPVTQINSGSSTTKFNLQRLVSEGKTLTVVGDNDARLVFYPDALNGIIRQVLGDIKVEIKDVSSQHQESLPGKIVFSLTVSSSSGTISNFGGRVTVSLPYELKEGESAQDVTVWHLADDGTMTEIPCTYDPATKLITFTAIHFSLYVVGVAEAQPWVNPFSDVTESDWFYSAVEYVNKNGLFAGTGADTFSPNSPMTRAMLWTVLGRLDGQNLSGSDVFDAARSWAVGAGITDGTNPDDSVTRQQMIAIMWRYAGSPRSDGDLSTFSDADNVADYADEAMAWAVQKSIVAGSNGALMPKDHTTRAQVAAVMQRFVEKGK